MAIRQSSREVTSEPAASSLGQALLDLFLNPPRVLLLWNWKSASLSIILRVPIFLAVTIRRGFAETVSAVLTECVYCALTAGFYGALVQNLRDATPTWLTGLFLTVIIPAWFQALEFAFHLFRGTPHLGLAEAISLVISAISSLFSWYAMRSGTLLVGGEGRRFGSDLAALPKLFFDFMTLIPRKLLGGGPGTKRNDGRGTRTC